MGACGGDVGGLSLVDLCPTAGTGLAREDSVFDKSRQPPPPYHRQHGHRLLQPAETWTSLPKSNNRHEHDFGTSLSLSSAATVALLHISAVCTQLRQVAVAERSCHGMPGHDHIVKRHLLRDRDNATQSFAHTAEARTTCLQTKRPTSIVNMPSCCAAAPLHRCATSEFGYASDSRVCWPATGLRHRSTAALRHCRQPLRHCRSP